MSKRFLTIVKDSLVILLFLSSPAYAKGWIYQNPYPTSYTLNGVKFVSPDKGWLVGQAGTIFYTEDGGKTWKKLRPSLHKYPWRPFNSQAKMEGFK